MRLGRISKILLMVFLLVCLLLGLLYILSGHDKAGLSLEMRKSLWRSARPEKSMLHSGDLIFRHGRGMVSATLLAASQTQKRYSHAGVISIEQGEVYVYHCIGGDDNPNERMSRDKLSAFCDPEIAYSFGIYRLPMHDTLSQQFMKLVLNGFESGVLFDSDFNLASDDRQYCTEFIYKTLKKMNGCGLPLNSSWLSGREYVACDNLYLMPNTTTIHTFNY